MKRFLPFSALLFLFASSLAAQAESIAYLDPRFGRQTVFVQIEYKSNLACEYLAAADRGAPGGASFRQYQLPITVTVARDGACNRRAQRLRLNKTVFVGFHQHDIKLFFVAPNGRLLKTESFSISER